VNSSIRVAIVDDHAIVRQGLRTLLTTMGMDVVGEADSGISAVEIASQHQPNVMLLDIRMKNQDGISALPHIKAASPHTAVIMLTTYANPTYFSEAVRGGAAGYLLKDSEPDDIVHAIQSAATHSYLFDPQLLNQAMGQPTINIDGKSKQNPFEMKEDIPSVDEQLDLIDPLSDREIDVLKLLAQGLTNAGIAEDLQVSITTVKTHVSHILRKLDVNDRTQAALVAARLNLEA